MKSFLFLLFTTLFLRGEILTEGEFFVKAAASFSITIEEVGSDTLLSTLQYDFTNDTSGAPIEMGQFDVNILDTTTLSPGESNSVILEALVTNGSTLQIRRINQPTALTSQEDRIDLDVLDSKNSDGTDASGDGRSIVAESVIRIRSFPEAQINPAETHRITVRSASGAIAGKTAGSYRTTFFFALVSV